MGLALEEPRDTDLTLDLDGLHVSAEPGLSFVLPETVLDWVDRGFERGFLVEREWGSC
jgi:Fe-S cluster assembly iron-binding protein IscA